MLKIFKIIVEDDEGNEYTIIEKDAQKAEETLQRASKLFRRARMYTARGEENYEDGAFIKR